MAPEVSGNPADANAPLAGYTLLSDSFSLGIVLLEMATGIAPWQPFAHVSRSQPYALQARAATADPCLFFEDPALPYAAALEDALPDPADRAGFREVLRALLAPVAPDAAAQLAAVEALRARGPAAPTKWRVEAGAVLAAAYTTQDAPVEQQRFQWLLRPSAAETAAAAAEAAAAAAEADAAVAEVAAAEARAVAAAVEAAAAAAVEAAVAKARAAADAAEAVAAEARAAAQAAVRRAAT